MSDEAQPKFSLRYPFALLENSRGGPKQYEEAHWNVISPADIRVAETEIASWPGYSPTRLCRLSGLANASGVSQLWYKDEGERFGLGSFKALGGAYAVLRLVQSRIAGRSGALPDSVHLRAGKYREVTKKFTVTSATDGNHGRSVAWGASLFGCRSVIYIPRQCSRAREEAIRGFGAAVTRTNVGYDETVRLCSKDAKLHGWTVVSDTSWDGYEHIPAMVMQGYTTMTSEILEQIRGEGTPTHVFVQAGVGGLAAAVCAHFEQHWRSQRPRIIVVEPKGAACLYASALAGKPTPASEKVHTMMAGLDCGEVSPLAWSLLARSADFFMTIADDAVPECMRLLATAPYGDQPIVAGESAIAGLAAFLSVSGNSQARNTLKLSPQSRVLLLGTEGDTDASIYQEIVGCSGEDIRRRAARSGGAK